MTAVDTSVVVPALLSWHEHHEPCRRAATGASIPAHAVIESYSVLTRLPSPHRLEGEVARRLLSGWFDAGAILPASARLQRTILARIAAGEVEGGAVYDALIGLTASEHDEVLLSRDRRAAACYARLDVSVELLA